MKRPDEASRRHADKNKKARYPARRALLILLAVSVLAWGFVLAAGAGIVRFIRNHLSANF
jgi:hypothetical protein